MTQQQTLPGWPRAIILLISVIALVIVAYHQTAWAMLSTWMSSNTFTHGFLIVPISVWLVWEKRHQLPAMIPAPTLLPAALMLVAGFGWFIADLVGVQLVQQLAFVSILIAAIWMVVGNRIARYLMFPLFFLYFAVPMGEQLVPPMMEFTADFTVLLIKLSGIPVYREGLFFSLPSGDWSVVKACSGIRYLIASVTLGFLFAYTTYTSNLRRTAFIIASIIVPIFANGIRAYIIVMLGHFSDMTLAVGVDHLIYGWVFFGIVMLLLFWIGSFWREDHVAVSARQRAESVIAVAPEAGSSMRLIFLVLVSLLIGALFWPAYATLLEQKIENDTATAKLIAPERLGDWALQEGVTPPWQPGYLGYDRALSVSYQNSTGERIYLHLILYQNQRQGHELISVKNRLIGKADKAWRNIQHTTLESRQTGIDATLREDLLRSPASDLLVWQWHRVGGINTINPYLAKLLEAKERMLGESGTGVAIFIAADHDTNSDQRALLKGFSSQINPWLNRL